MLDFAYCYNVAVGTAEGTGLVKCMQALGKKTGNVVDFNGSPTDNNATLFKQGYDKVIRGAGYTVVADQSVPDWDNTKAGTIFEQIFAAQKGKIDGVDAANDGLGGAVVAVLARNGLAGKVPVTGQDATDPGLQRVLLGTQCVTVYKAIKKEADAASALAIALAKGDTQQADALATGTVQDTQTNFARARDRDPGIARCRYFDAARRVPEAARLVRRHRARDAAVIALGRALETRFREPRERRLRAVRDRARRR